MRLYTDDLKEAMMDNTTTTSNSGSCTTYNCTCDILSPRKGGSTDKLSLTMDDLNLATVDKDSQSTNSRTSSRNGSRMHTGRLIHSRTTSYDTLYTTSLGDEGDEMDRYPHLPMIETVPWSPSDILSVLYNGKLRKVYHFIPKDVIQRLSEMLQRPLIRIALEAQRLSQNFVKCSKCVMQSVVKIVLPCGLSDLCISSALKATSLYAMCGRSITRSRKSRAGIIFSVGQFHRWLLDVAVCLRIDDFAAIFLAAVMERLLEELTMRAVGSNHDSETLESLTIDKIEHAIDNDVEMWGLVQNFQHLATGRNINGVQHSLSSHHVGNYGVDGCGTRTRRGPKTNGSLDPNKPVEQSLLATCVGSLSELSDLVSSAVHYQASRYHSVQALTPATKFTMTWNEGALRTLFYYMKCNQLECDSENQTMHPPSPLLTSDSRPTSMMPPLNEWVRVAMSHAEHRHSPLVDDDDVKQAARLLLPWNDCPPRPLSYDDSLCSSRYLDTKSSAQSYQQQLAFKILTSGRTDLVVHAISLLGPGKVNCVNEQVTYILKTYSHKNTFIIKQINRQPLKCSYEVDRSWLTVTPESSDRGDSALSMA